MTLKHIVAALGGELYCGGRRANVPAPGHSTGDRSVSLLLDGDRLIIHGFGAAGWRAVREDLLGRGLIDAACRPTASPASSAQAPASHLAARPDRRARLAAAQRIWAGAADLTEGCVSHRHLVGRAVRTLPGDLCDLRHHPAAPVSVFRPEGATRPALVARISDGAGVLTAVELVYLEPNGRMAKGLRLPRKTVGILPPGSAVRLAPVAQTLVVGEGVMTVLSAAAHFRLPGWALLSAHNLSAWIAPLEARRVLVAADRGPAGEAAGAALRRRLRATGVSVRLVLPEPPFEDWNEAATAARRREEGR
ncbi:toprim domain-containing protein [Brevundimonas sp.]|uniref:toprim domain-containing protein n=1 Tax=Brevundimonas sp. TaxID=1871086 RepID=UPI0025BB88A1|nr:toprim domain-containing protein [Brevundimonas sp.]